MASRRTVAAARARRRSRRALVATAPVGIVVLGAALGFRAPVGAVNGVGEAVANPLAGARLYVDPGSPARAQAQAWQHARPADAALMRAMADQPKAIWFGDWNRDITGDVNRAASDAARAGALPVFVAYNIPGRDCGLYSAGGARGDDHYRRWVRDFARGLGGRRAVVILEPDAVAGMDCLPQRRQHERLALLADAVQVLKAQKAAVYIDAGHSNWIDAAEMGRRLRQAGVAHADGFALNVSNYYGNAANIAYGERVSSATGGKHFVIDTSRNGLGSSGEWCNAADRALGTHPTTRTWHPLVDAFLWIKRPGESDGTCAGGPRAGEWWPEYAVGLARRQTQEMAAVQR
jgi:endoglucanase